MRPQIRYRIRPSVSTRRVLDTNLGYFFAEIISAIVQMAAPLNRMPGAGNHNSEIVMSTYIEYGSFYHDRERGEITIEAGHPSNYVDCTITCACGNVIHNRDTKPEIQGGRSAASPPLSKPTKQKVVDTGGRVRRFKRRFAKSGK